MTILSGMKLSHVRTDLNYTVTGEHTFTKFSFIYLAQAEAESQVSSCELLPQAI